MIEFVMSRMWMFIAGLAVAVVVLAAFGGLNAGIAGEKSTEGAESIAEIIDALEDEGGEVEMRIEVDRMVDGREIVIRPGSIWVLEDGRSRAVACSPDIVLMEGGKRVDELQLASGEVIVIRASSGEVQLEKVSTMWPNASTNVRHSSSVL